VIGVFILMTVTVVHCWAQTETARVSGQITDAAGRSVPKADVRMVNLATGVDSTTTTNDEGIYSFTGLIPGRYRVMVQKQGFREVIIDGLTLNVQEVPSPN
jgi:protocatechuate 3,4-dioxygenase beta subunit